MINYVFKPTRHFLLGSILILACATLVFGGSGVTSDQQWLRRSSTPSCVECEFDNKIVPEQKIILVREEQLEIQKEDVFITENVGKPINFAGLLKKNYAVHDDEDYKSKKAGSTNPLMAKSTTTTTVTATEESLELEVKETGGYDYLAILDVIANTTDTVQHLRTQVDDTVTSIVTRFTAITGIVLPTSNTIVTGVIVFVIVFVQKMIKKCMCRSGAQRRQTKKTLGEASTAKASTEIVVANSSSVALTQKSETDSAKFVNRTAQNVNNVDDDYIDFSKMVYIPAKGSRPLQQNNYGSTIQNQLQGFRPRVFMWHPPKQDSSTAATILCNNGLCRKVPKSTARSVSIESLLLQIQTAAQNAELSSPLPGSNTPKSLSLQVEAASKIMDNILGDRNTSSLEDVASTCGEWGVQTGRDVSFDDIIKYGKSLDLIGVRSTTGLAQVITTVQHHARQCSAITHVGLLIFSDVFGDIAGLDETSATLRKYGPREPCVLEAVIGGGIVGDFDTVPDIFNNAINGVQIRSLREIMNAEENQNVIFTWCPMTEAMRAKADKCIHCVNKETCPLRKGILDTYGIPYPANIFKFFAGLLPFGAANMDHDEKNGRTVEHDSVWWSTLNLFLPQYMSDYANSADDTGSSNNSVSSANSNSRFCSELCVEILCFAGVLPKNLLLHHARRFYPVDFIRPSSAESSSGTGLPVQVYSTMHVVFPPAYSTAASRSSVLVR